MVFRSIPITSNMAVIKDNGYVIVSEPVQNYMPDEGEQSTQLLYKFKEIANNNAVFYQLISIEKALD